VDRCCKDTARGSEGLGEAGCAAAAVGGRSVSEVDEGVGGEERAVVVPSTGEDEGKEEGVGEVGRLVSFLCLWC
jgi:hypothetical protein